MTIKDLKLIISDLPDNMDVRVSQTNTEFESSECEHGRVENILFQSADIQKKEWPKIKCLVLTDKY